MQFDTMLTVDEYARLPRESHRLELSRGLLVKRPHPSVHHADVAARICERLRAYAASHGGHVQFHGHFLLQDEPPTVRGPDVAFIARGPAPPLTEAGFFRGPPDIAIEVAPHSRDGAPADLIETAFEYLDAGCRAVWLVDLIDRSVTVYEREAEPIVYSAGHIIRGGSVLPGFAQPVTALFR